MRRRTLITLPAAVALAACSKPAPQRYPMKGVVVSLDEKTKSANIKHERIEGWMEAMTMEFPVKDDADWQKLKPGARIQGVVVVTGDSYHLAEVQVQP